MKLTKLCLVCGDEFEKPSTCSLADWFGSVRRPLGKQFCSTECGNKSRRGKSSWNKGVAWSDEQHEKILAVKKGKHYSPRTEFQKGLKPWNIGKEYSADMCRRISEASPWKGKVKEETSSWKGDRAGYHAKHVYLVAHHGHPPKCEHCGIKGEFIVSGKGRQRWSIDWANKDGNYSRDVKDYFGLCRPCHNRYDKSRLKGDDKQP